MREKIIILRNELGLSQKQLADYLEIDQSYVSKMEKGERPITLDNAEKLALLSGYDLSYFMSDQPREPINISFRANSLGANDLRVIAKINELALNLDFMNKLNQEKNSEK